MSVISEGNNLGDVLKFEGPNLYSREEITVLGGSGSDRILVIGEVLGKRTKSDVVVAADGGNTGDGTAGTVTLGAMAETGTYTLTCITAAANAGTFQVQTPKGYVLPNLEVGQPYAGDHFNLTISDGTTDFVVGDKFTLGISGDGKVVALELAGMDGSQKAVGVIAANVTAPDGTDTNSVAIVRQAIVSDAALIWPAGITAQQKSDATAQLEAVGIIILKGA